MLVSSHLSRREEKKLLYELSPLSRPLLRLIPLRQRSLLLLFKFHVRQVGARRWKLCEVITHPKHENKQKKKKRTNSGKKNEKNVFRTKMSAGAAENGNLSKWEREKQQLKSAGGWKINCQRCYTHKMVRLVRYVFESLLCNSDDECPLAFCLVSNLSELF